MFATFSSDLKVAMKGAAIRNEWRADTWTLQVGLVSDALLRGEDPEALADAYSIILESQNLPELREKPRPLGRGGCQMNGEAMKPCSNLVEFHPIKNSPERGAPK
ncbi:MAG: hypothetical protein IPK63_18690 [Candidatus Competibacteraceae bacterium]|nr:hypothetical protein [Candidatus Competibacteraceae bacterium]